MRYSYLAVPALLAWVAATLVSMLYGTNYAWPDFFHVNYGFPLTFATHTLNTIAGPVDSWSLDIASLTADLALWVSGMVIISFAGMYLGFRSRRQ